jgi:hypothetical protein
METEKKATPQSYHGFCFHLLGNKVITVFCSGSIVFMVNNWTLERNATSTPFATPEVSALLGRKKGVQLKQFIFKII